VLSEPVDSCNADGSPQQDPNDYFHHLQHIEEETQVLANSKMRFEPDQVNKSMAMDNLEYHDSIDGQRDRIFYANISTDLLLRGQKNNEQVYELCV